MYFILDINVRTLYLSEFPWDLLPLKEHMQWLLAREALSLMAFPPRPCSRSLSDCRDVATGWEASLSVAIIQGAKPLFLFSNSEAWDNLLLLSRLPYWEPWLYYTQISVRPSQDQTIHRRLCLAREPGTYSGSCEPVIFQSTTHHNHLEGF